MQDLAYIHVHTNKNLDGHCKWSRHIGSKSSKDQKTSHIHPSDHKRLKNFVPNAQQDIRDTNKFVDLIKILSLFFETSRVQFSPPIRIQKKKEKCAKIEKKNQEKCCLQSGRVSIQKIFVNISLFKIHQTKSKWA